VCGHVGCGRYVKGHAVQHFETTDHNFAYDVATRRVWDYLQDEFVHRLVQNKSDGKLVGIERPRRHRLKPEESHNDQLESLRDQANKKLDVITMDYNFLLSSQLETQRLFFQEQLQFLQREKDSQIHEVETKRAQLAAQVKHLTEKCIQLQSTLNHETEEIHRIESSIQKCVDTTKQLNAENDELIRLQKQREQRLKEDDAAWEAKKRALLAEKDSQIAALTEEYKELKFHVDTQRVASRNPEAAGGQVIVLGDPTENRHKPAKDLLREQIHARISALQHGKQGAAGGGRKRK